MMDFLYFLQFACFIFMLINALILGITHLHMKWTNRRYEWSRWMILAGMMGLAIQYLLQMLLGFRAKSDDLGAIFNILVYTPCITTIAMGIYNIEATHANRRKMYIVWHRIHTKSVQSTVEHVGLDTHLIERLAECTNCIIRILTSEEVYLLESTAIGLYTAKASHLDDYWGYLSQLILAWLELTRTLPHVSIYETELNFLLHYYLIISLFFSL